MKRRNPLVVVLLSLITFGIYDIYWLVKTKKELNQKTNFHVPTIWLLVAPLPIMIAGFILMVANTHTAPGVTTSPYGYQVQNTTTTGAGGGIGIALFFLSMIAFFVVSMIWFFKFSKAVNQYTQGKMSTATTFLILWLIHLIGVALIQDAFNDMLATGQAGSSPTPQAPVATAPPQSAPPQPTAGPAA